MAINVSFNGATIVKPGAYSKLNIDLGGGFPLGPTGLIAIFGESTQGKPGSEEADIAKNVYSASQIAQVRQKYGTGPIVDAMNFLFSPASDGAIPGGAQAVYVYKTNASSRASFNTLTYDGNYGTIRSLEYGSGSNLITASNELTERAELSASSTAAFDVTAVATGSIYVYANGVRTEVSVTGGYADYAAFTADVDTWSATNVSFSYTDEGGDTAILKITVDLDTDSYGYGAQDSLHLEAGQSTSFGDMNLSEQSYLPATDWISTLILKQTRDLLEEQETIGGNVVLLGKYTGTEAAASMSSFPGEFRLNDGVTTTSFFLQDYSTLSQLVDAMNLVPDWEFSLTSNLYNSLSPLVLDQTYAAAKSDQTGSYTPIRIKKDAYEVRQFFLGSSIAEMVSFAASSIAGLFQGFSETPLTGGARGGTTTASITSALSAFEEIRVNSVIPLFSRDDAADKADNLTDASSSYTLLGIHQAVKSHCNFMATTRNRSERQGYLSIKDTFANCLDRAALLADSRLQLCIQDTRNIDSIGAIKWFQPWSQSCLVAGARAGSPVGTPLTFKFFNATGIRHTAQSMSTAEEDIVIDFNPNKAYDQAINGGITFFEEPQSGGIRCVVDNTTYQKDSSWVYNRGNVLYAADVLSFDFRNQLENIYVGQKNTVSAAEVQSTAASIMNTFLAQGITVSTSDAPNGYKSLTVQIDGNIIRVNVTAVLVEGIDFVLSEITVTRAQSEA